MLEDLYFFAQIIAAFAIVCSLLFVGLQIRASMKEQKLTRANEGADNYSRFQVLLIENPEFRDVWIKGADDINTLTPSELLAYGAYLALWVDSVRRMKSQTTAGYAINSLKDARARFKPITRRNGTHQWWRKARLGYEEDVRMIVDEILSDANFDAQRAEVPSK